MERIQSTKNEKIKNVKKLHKKRVREQEGKYLIEGFHLIEEAQKAGEKLLEVFVTERGAKEWEEFLSSFDFGLVTAVSDEVMNALSDLPTPQGICAVVEMNLNTVVSWKGKWLFLDNVQDPGNVGTMIRTADAFGLDGVVLGNGSVDIYNTKVLRSMQGSNYHLKVVSRDLPSAIDSCKSEGVPVFATALDPQAKRISEVGKLENFVLVMGNEGKGVSNEVLEKSTQTVYIEMPGQAESLNVAVACGIALYELRLK